MADQHEAGEKEVLGYGGGRLRSPVMGGREWLAAREQALEIGQKRRRRGLWIMEKLAWEDRLGSANSLGRGELAVLSPGGAYAQEHPREVRVPGGTCCAGAQSILESAVEPLDETIRLGMIGGGRRMYD